MREEDLPEVLAIEKSCFPNPWSQEIFRAEIQNKTISYPLVAVDRGMKRLVSYVIFWKVGDEAQINNLAVHPDFQGQGLGELTMRYVLERLKESGVKLVTLEVRASNQRAQALYKKLGFSLLGVRKGYYTRPDEDAFLLGLELG